VARRPRAPPTRPSTTAWRRRRSSSVPRSDLPPAEKKEGDDDPHEDCVEDTDPDDRTGDADYDEDEPTDKAPPPEPEPGDIEVHGSNEAPPLPGKDKQCQKEEPEKSKCGEQDKDPTPPAPPDTPPPAPEPDPDVQRPDLGPAITDAERQRDATIGALEGEQLAAAVPIAGLDEMVASSIRFAPPSANADAARDHETSQSIASTAIAGAAGEVRAAATAAARVTIERLGPALASAKLDIARSAAIAKQEISAGFEAARADARRDAAQARGEVDAAFIASVIRAVMGTVTTAAAIEAERRATSGLVDAAAVAEQGIVGRKVIEGQLALIRIGVEKGHRAIKIGDAAWSHYHKGRINRKDSFLKGHLTDRRAEARKKAARDTSVAYRDQFVNAAANQAWQFGRAKPSYCKQVVATTMGAQRVIEQQASAFTAALGEMLPQVLSDASDARSQLIGAIDDKLAQQLRTLDRNEQAQRQAADDTAYLQQVVAEQTARAAATQLLRGTSRAAQALYDILAEARARLEGSESPPPAQVRAAMDQLRGTIASGVAHLGEQHGAGVDDAEAALRDQVDRARLGLEELDEHAIEIAANLSLGFGAAMEAAGAAAARAFKGLSDGYDQQLQKLLVTAMIGFTCALAGVMTAFAKLNEAIDKGSTSQATQLGQSFDEQLGDRQPQATPSDGCTEAKPATKVRTLPQDITQYACEAANQEKPAWEEVLKWVLIIIVIVAIMVVLGPIVAELVGEGLLFLAAMGAITSVAVNGINNLFAGRPFFKGALKAAVIGAISGLVSGGLGGGALGGGAAAIEGPLLTYLARQFVVDMVTEYVSQVAGNLWEGRGWSSLWKVDWDGFKTAALMSGPMALFGRGLHLRAKARAAGAEPHATGATAEPPHVEVEPPHVEAQAPRVEAEPPRVEGEPQRGEGDASRGDADRAAESGEPSPGGVEPKRGLVTRALDRLVDVQEWSRARGRALAKGIRGLGGRIIGPRSPTRTSDIEPTAPQEPGAPPVVAAASVPPPTERTTTERSAGTAAHDVDPTAHAEPGPLTQRPTETRAQQEPVGTGPDGGREPLAPAEPPREVEPTVTAESPGVPSGEPGPVAHERPTVREIEGGGKLTTTPEGKIRLCVNPCVELQHLGMPEDVIAAALENFQGARTQRVELVETLAAFRGETDLPVIRDLITDLAKGGPEAAHAADFLDRLAQIRGVAGVEVDLPALHDAFDNGDAILSHGPLQEPIFLEDMIGHYEISDGRISFGEKNVPKALSTEFGRVVDFVIMRVGDGFRLVLGRNHSGLSGGEPSVFAAGEFRLDKQGFIDAMTNRSGHYVPSQANLERALSFLRERGILSSRRAIDLQFQGVP
jgi:hypothetical protein